MNFYSALFIIGLPLIVAVIGYVKNRIVEERKWQPQLNVQQQFNYQLLLANCRLKSPDQLDLFKAELLKHGWDPVVVERVFSEIKGSEHERS